MFSAENKKKINEIEIRELPFFIGDVKDLNHLEIKLRYALYNSEYALYYYDTDDKLHQGYWVACRHGSRAYKYGRSMAGGPPNICYFQLNEYETKGKITKNISTILSKHYYQLSEANREYSLKPTNKTISVINPTPIGKKLATSLMSIIKKGPQPETRSQDIEKLSYFTNEKDNNTASTILALEAAGNSYCVHYSSYTEGYRLLYKDSHRAQWSRKLNIPKGIVDYGKYIDDELKKFKTFELNKTPSPFISGQKVNEESILLKEDKKPKAFSIPHSHKAPLPLALDKKVNEKSISLGKNNGSKEFNAPNLPKEPSPFVSDKTNQDSIPLEKNKESKEFNAPNLPKEPSPFVSEESIPSEEDEVLSPTMDKKLRELPFYVNLNPYKAEAESQSKLAEAILNREPFNTYLLRYSERFKQFVISFKDALGEVDHVPVRNGLLERILAYNKNDGKFHTLMQSRLKFKDYFPGFVKPYDKNKSGVEISRLPFFIGNVIGDVKSLNHLEIKLRYALSRGTYALYYNNDNNYMGYWVAYKRDEGSKEGPPTICHFPMQKLNKNDLKREGEVTETILLILLSGHHHLLSKTGERQRSRIEILWNTEPIDESLAASLKPIIEQGPQDEIRFPGFEQLEYFIEEKDNNSAFNILSEASVNSYFVHYSSYTDGYRLIFKDSFGQTYGIWLASETIAKLNNYEEYNNYIDKKLNEFETFDQHHKPSPYVRSRKINEEDKATKIIVLESNKKLEEVNTSNSYKKLLPPIQGEKVNEESEAAKSASSENAMDKLSVAAEADLKKLPYFIQDPDAAIKILEEAPYNRYLVYRSAKSEQYQLVFKDPWGRIYNLPIERQLSLKLKHINYYESFARPYTKGEKSAGINELSFFIDKQDEESVAAALKNAPNNTFYCSLNEKGYYLAYKNIVGQIRHYDLPNEALKGDVANNILRILSKHCYTFDASAKPFSQAMIGKNEEPKATPSISFESIKNKMELLTFWLGSGANKQYASSILSRAHANKFFLDYDGEQYYLLFKNHKNQIDKFPVPKEVQYYLLKPVADANIADIKNNNDLLTDRINWLLSLNFRTFYLEPYKGEQDNTQLRKLNDSLTFKMCTVDLAETALQSAPNNSYVIYNILLDKKIKFLNSKRDYDSFKYTRPNEENLCIGFKNVQGKISHHIMNSIGENLVNAYMLRHHPDARPYVKLLEEVTNGETKEAKNNSLKNDMPSTLDEKLKKLSFYIGIADNERAKRALRNAPSKGALCKGRFLLHRCSLDNNEYTLTYREHEGKIYHRYVSSQAESCILTHINSLLICLGFPDIYSGLYIDPFEPKFDLGEDAGLFADVFAPSEFDLKENEKTQKNNENAPPFSAEMKPATLEAEKPAKLNEEKMQNNKNALPFSVEMKPNLEEEKVPKNSETLFTVKAKLNTKTPSYEAKIATIIWRNLMDEKSENAVNMVKQAISSAKDAYSSGGTRSTGGGNGLFASAFTLLRMGKSEFRTAGMVIDNKNYLSVLFQLLSGDGNVNIKSLKGCLLQALLNKCSDVKSYEIDIVNEFNTMYKQSHEQSKTTLTILHSNILSRLEKILTQINERKPTK